MSKLSKEQIKACEANFSFYSPVKLMCDGYKVNCCLRKSGMKLVVEIFINDMFKGKWMFTKNGHDETRFFRKRYFYVKDIVKNKIVKVKRESDVRNFSFASLGQALRHFNKVCDSVEVWDDSKHGVED